MASELWPTASDRSGLKVPPALGHRCCVVLGAMIESMHKEEPWLSEGFSPVGAWLHYNQEVCKWEKVLST